MGVFLQKLRLIFTDRALRNRVFFLVGMLLVFRFLASVPIPGIDTEQLRALLSGNQFLGLLNIFSGGGLSNLSIVMLGVGPYITASIIMQLLTIMVPKLKSLYQEEGEAGRAKFAQYTRLLTPPLALLQGFGYLVLLSRQGVVPGIETMSFAVSLIVIAAASVLLMWIGELVTEFGIGNGVSLIIFAGIVAAIPTNVGQALFSFDISQIPVIIGFIVVALLITAGVVVVTEAERPIPITYAKRVRGSQTFGGSATYLPLRVNQAGVIPIIFALSILLFPQMILNVSLQYLHGTPLSIATEALHLFSNSYFYGILYFIFVFFFTYFYTAVTFDPDTIARNLQQGGAFIPGVRPGQTTSEYIGNILTRITFVGALFLGIIAVLPLIMQNLTGIKSLAIGGTALLIAVSVILDLVRKVDAQISMREY
jgi:preprotein translocase subunit SecY